MPPLLHPARRCTCWRKARATNTATSTCCIPSLFLFCFAAVFSQQNVCTATEGLNIYRADLSCPLLVMPMSVCTCCFNCYWLMSSSSEYSHRRRKDTHKRGEVLPPSLPPSLNPPILFPSFPHSFLPSLPPSLPSSLPPLLPPSPPPSLPPSLSNYCKPTPG